MKPSFIRRVAAATLTALLLPFATAWIAFQERQILARGEPLNAQQQHDASALGVEHIARIRVLYVRDVPLPRGRFVRLFARRFGFLPTRIAGLTARYGIFMRAECASDASLVRHELAHTAQYERARTIPRFLARYLYECLSVGYASCSLEADARMRSA